MIYTVFFTGKDSNKMPHDCETYDGAVEYAEAEGGEYTIESTSGTVV
jgi:hypothetical protein